MSVSVNQTVNINQGDSRLNNLFIENDSQQGISSQKSEDFSPQSPFFKDPSFFNLNYDNSNVPPIEHLLEFDPLRVDLWDQNLKLSESYDGPGFPLEDHIYPSDLRPDQKRSILRSLISEEAKKTNPKFVNKDEGWNGLLKLFKSYMADKKWPGSLDDYQSEHRHYYLNCGSYGKQEQNKKGDTRYFVTRCNQRKMCPEDSIRYYKGHGVQVGKKIMAAMQASGVNNLRKFRFPFPDFIRDQIKTPKQMNKFIKPLNKMLQAFYGCKMKGVNGYIEGKVGVGFQTHWYSTRECFRKSPHLHSWVLPIKIVGDKEFNVDRRISKADLKMMYKAFADVVKKVSTKFGFEDVDKIPDELVVDAAYIQVLNNMAEKGSPSMNLKYDYRSPVEDLIKAIVAMDLEQGLLIMKFRREEFEYYAVWKVKDFFELMEEKLQIKGDHVTYGWFHRFEKHASTLGIGIDEVQDDFDPDPDLT